MRFALICAGFILSISTHVAFAQEASENTPQKNDEAVEPVPQSTMAIGVTAGLLSGIGFAFRLYPSGEAVAHHIGGSVLATDDSVWMNLGYEYLFYLANFGNSRLSWVSGVSNIYYGDAFERSNILSVGTGVGFEYGGSRGFNFAFELPLSVSIYHNKILKNNTFQQNEKELSFKLYPIPAAMLLYRF